MSIDDYMNKLLTDNYYDKSWKDAVVVQRYCHVFALSLIIYLAVQSLSKVL